jgi:hypothetical protein
MLTYADVCWPGSRPPQHLHAEVARVLLRFLDAFWPVRALEEYAHVPVAADADFLPAANMARALSLLRLTAYAIFCFCCMIPPFFCLPISVKLQTQAALRQHSSRPHTRVA